MSSLDTEIFATAYRWHQANRRFAIALVCESWGSSPRAKGAAMLIDETGRLAGSVSGGCVEAEVIEAAYHCLANATAVHLHFGVTDDMAWSNGLSCGGEISLLCLPVEDQFLSGSCLGAITTALQDRQHATMTINKTDFHAQIHNKEVEDKDKDKDKDEDKDEEAAYHFAITPTRQLIIIGAGHIAQALVPLALTSGFAISVIDPRASFITKQRFPPMAEGAADLKEGWPSTHLSADKIDSNSAIVTLTHNPVIDDEALGIALASQAFHIAALGSRKTHQKRLARLASTYGYDEARLARIKGPAGIAIGAATPAEIAVSILAELIHAYRIGKADDS